MTLEELADSFDRLTHKLVKIANNDGNLSVMGQATAIAMLVSMNLETLTEASTALRAHAQGRRERKDG